MDDIKKMTETLIQAKVIEAFRETPDMIDALVRSAMSEEVNDRGGKPQYSEKKMPYLEYYVGETIRQIAREQVVAAVKSRLEDITTLVNKALTKEALVDGIITKLLGTMEEEWRVNVTFSQDD